MHYEREAGAYTGALAAGSLKIDESNKVSATSGFHLAAAFEQSKALWEEQGFGQARDRADLMSRLDGAINDSGKSVRLDL